MNGARFSKADFQKSGGGNWPIRLPFVKLDEVHISIYKITESAG